jgi:DNA-binding transcriptional ArsR family regulator
VPPTTPLEPEVFAAIAHPVRRQILDLLRQDERHVNAIAENFGVSRPAISQHLRILLDSGLVTERRDGRHRQYRLMADRLSEVHDWLSHYERFWTKKLAALDNYLKENE